MYLCHSKTARLFLPKGDSIGTEWGIFMEMILVSACLLGIGCQYSREIKADERVCKLLERKDVVLIPVCPEQLGGLPTPREPAERKDGGVWNRSGENVTKQFLYGAREALKLARMYGCSLAILKERSPSCGSGKIYDGSFAGNVVDGDGVTAELLKEHGIRVIGESQIGAEDKTLFQ